MRIVSLSNIETLCVLCLWPHSGPDKMTSSVGSCRLLAIVEHNGLHRSTSHLLESPWVVLALCSNVRIPRKVLAGADCFVFVTTQSSGDEIFLNYYCRYESIWYWWQQLSAFHARWEPRVTIAPIEAIISHLISKSLDIVARDRIDGRLKSGVANVNSSH